MKTELPKPSPIESIKALLEDHESMRRKYKESVAGPCAIQRDARMALLDLDNENRQLLESVRYLASLRVQDCEKCGAQGKFRGVNCSECYNGQVVVSAVLPDEVQKARVLYSLFQRPYEVFRNNPHCIHESISTQDNAIVCNVCSQILLP